MGNKRTFATAIITTREIILEQTANILLFSEVFIGFPLSITYAPMIVDNSARHFMNPLNGSRNDMIAKETKHVAVPESKPKDKYPITIGIPIMSNFKNGRRGKGILKNLDNSRTATTAPKIAVPATSTLFLSR